MAIDFFSSIDLNKNELQNAVVQNVGSAPSSPVEGQIYYDTGDDTIYFRNATAWINIAQQGDITGVTAGDGLTGGGTSGAVTLNVVGGTGITANANDIALTNGLIADGSNITSVGTIGTGVWQGTVVASAYLDADTAHLSGNQTFTGTKTLNSFKGTGGATVTNILDEDAMGSNSATALATQQSIKAYADTKSVIAGSTSLVTLGTVTTGVWNGTAIASAYLDADTAHLTTAQTFTGSKTMGTTTKLNFRDANAYINSPTANDIEVVATTITLDAGSDIQLEGDTTVTGNFSVSGTLNVDGTTTTIDSTTVAIADSMLKLAKDQDSSTDAVDFGFYGAYGDGTQKYAGVFRDLSATGDPFTFFDSLQAEPGATVNTAGTGYDLADISAGGITAADGFTGDITGDVTGNADTVTTNANLTGHITSSGNAAVLGSFTVAQLSAALSNASISGNNTGDQTKSDIEGLAIQTVGAITSGSWTATDVAIAHGGTGSSSASDARTALGVAYASAGDIQTGTEAAKVVTPDTLAAKSVVATIAQASLTDDNRVTITHNLGTADVIVQLFDMTTEANVQADIARTTDDMSTASTSVVTIDFGRAPENDIRCLITSLKGASAGLLAYT